MKYNYDTYNYTRLNNLPNVICLTYKDAPPLPEPSYIVPFLKKLVTKVALTHPDWTLASAGAVGSPVVSSFQVYRGTEVIGEITQSYRYGTKTGNRTLCFKLLSARIDGYRNSGSRVTKDERIAWKTIKEFFKPMSDSELSHAVRTNIYNEVSRVAATIEQEAVRAYRRAQGPVMAVLHHLQTATEMPEELSRNESFVQVIAAYELHKVSDKVKTAMTNNAGAYIRLLDNGDVLFIRRDNLDKINYETFRKDALAENIALKLTMLKLVPERQFLEDTGYHGEDNNFFVML